MASLKSVATITENGPEEETLPAPAPEVPQQGLGQLSDEVRLFTQKNNLQPVATGLLGRREGDCCGWLVLPGSQLLTLKLQRHGHIPFDHRDLRIRMYDQDSHYPSFVFHSVDNSRTRGEMSIDSNGKNVSRRSWARREPLREKTSKGKVLGRNEHAACIVDDTGQRVQVPSVDFPAWDANQSAMIPSKQPLKFHHVLSSAVQCIS